MEKKKIATNIKLREFAQEQQISPTTLYRVLNNDPNVRPATRKRIVKALNRRGYYAYQSGNAKIVMDFFVRSSYLLFFGTKLMQSLSGNGFTISATNYREKRIAFLDAVAEADAVIYCSNPDESIIEEAKKANPHIFSITLFGSARNADIRFCSNDAFGGQLVAQHLYDLGHRKHVAVHQAWFHSDAEKRIFYFSSAMKRLAPDCRIDHLYQKVGADFYTLCRDYFLERKETPSVIYFPMCSAACIFRNAILPFLPDNMKNIGIMSYDNYAKQHPGEETEKLDRVDFSTEDILRWVEYLLKHRPMLGNDDSVEIAMNVKLYVENSVPDLTETI